MIPYGRQSISEEDISAVMDVLRSDWLTQGPVVPEFESRVAAYVGDFQLQPAIVQQQDGAGHHVLRQFLVVDAANALVAERAVRVQHEGLPLLQQDRAVAELGDPEVLIIMLHHNAVLV